MFKDGQFEAPDLTTQEGQQKFRKQAADIQDGLATLNDCTRARKCNLVPHGNKSNSELKRGSQSKNVEPSTNGGCCKGQTGHHLLPDALIKDAKCSKYKYAEAPTVCAEGGVTNGSHGRVHDAMDNELIEKLKDGKIVNDKISLDDAIDAAATSHMKAFPLSLCRKDCIRSQLEDYYSKACKQSNPMLDAKNKGGNEISEKTLNSDETPRAGAM